MRLRLLLFLFCCPFWISCGFRTASKTVEVDLIKQFVYAEKLPDTQILASRSPLFHFSAPLVRPLYLHLKLPPAFPQSAELFVNSKFLSRVPVNGKSGAIVVPLPADMMTQGENVLELKSGTVDSATISGSKYVREFKSDNSFHNFWATGLVTAGSKRLPAILCKTGGSISYLEKMNRDTVLRFGFRFQPSAAQENDDFAEFSVLVRKDGGKEHIIFQKRVTADTLEFVHLPLAGFVTEEKPSIYEMEFRLKRNTIFDSGQTAWIQPLLERPESTTSKISLNALQREELNKVRSANKDANVLVIVLDAAGAKHFGCYGYKRNTTPAVDHLARSGLRFTRAYSEAAYTLASTATLMSGAFPDHHRVLYLKNRLPSVIRTLPEVFRDHGYETGTFVANGNASTAFGMTQGFKTIAEVFKAKNYTGWGKDVTNHLTDWLSRNSTKKLFAYVHYREPHDPFNPPEEWVSKFVDLAYAGNIGRTFESRIKIETNSPNLTAADREQIKNLYDANLAYGDSQVGQVVKKLQQLGIDDRTILIITADHGESFWEHGFQGHNSQVYQESIHIPLVIRLLPGSLSTPQIIDRTIRTADFFPTLIDLFGFSAKGFAVEGTSFLPYFVFAGGDDREVMSQTTKERQFSYLDGDDKYIIDVISRKEELYNLKDDPEERRNLVAEKPVRTKYYRTQILGRLARNRAMLTLRKTEKAVMDESTRENLKALGYLDH